MMAFAHLEDKTGSIELIIFPRTYEESASMLAVGQVVAVAGRVKETEEDSAQIVCEEIITPEQALQGLWKSHHSAGKSHQVQAKPQEGPVQSTKAVPGKEGLYLKFPSAQSDLVGKAENLLFVFEGSLPVYFYYGDTGKYLKAPRGHWVSPNDVLTRELARLLGSQNVALKQ